MADDLRILPGGLVTAKPAHLIGTRGAAPLGITTPDGFQNLIQLNEDVAWALLNGSTDEKATEGVNTLLLGGNTKGSGDCIDVAAQALLTSIIDVPVETGVGVAPRQRLNANGEISGGGLVGTDGTRYGAYGQVFTVAGTVTVAAANPTITGAGSTWTTNVLTANYAVAAANLSRNLIEAGDIIAVGAAGSRVYFRIIGVTDDTHLIVFPTPTAGNPAIGAGKAYTIFRTGYGSWSRMVTPIVGTSDHVWGYYAGNSGLQTANGRKSGTVEAVRLYSPNSTGPAADHFQAPKSVDSAGAFVADLQADDVAFYKGYLLYGAGSAISWSVATFPTAEPFGPTDFPAANIEVINRTGRFVSFEYLGDQLVAIFEDSMWLVTATGAVPDFAFYRLPEPLSVQHAARAEPCTIIGGLSFGRPTCSGRGAIFYVSPRGLERGTGGLSEEVSAPISNSLTTIVQGRPYFLSWDDSFDLVFMRAAFPATFPDLNSDTSLVFAVGTGQWSTVKLQQVTGQGIVGMTAGIDPKSQINDEPRLMHLGYYEVLSNAGTPGTNGGNVRHLTTGLDRDIQKKGLVPWVWTTPVIPCGLEYGGFQFGGFILDAMTDDSTLPAASVSWSLYSGSSPYNLVLRQSNTLDYAGTQKATWVSSNERQGQKDDRAFVQLRFTSTSWVQLAGVILLNSNTQAKR